MIIGTAGHIDHGKTTLVRALTGVDTDRLPEEKKRGISIELGYAFLDLDDAPAAADGELPRRIGFIDVPGHERLVHTMLAGATGIDHALLLVAADDGVMPQTREHLSVLAMLGIARGTVAITKIDRADAARLQAVHEEVTALLQGTALAGSPVFEVSAVEGRGIAQLKAHLRAVARVQRAHTRSGDAFRLAIDRAFTLDGVGTVVTGTVHAGGVAVGDTLVLVPDAAVAVSTSANAPTGAAYAGLPVRVRSAHAQNRVVQRVQAGERAALALAGVSREQIERGQWLVAGAVALGTRRIDATLQVWPAEERALKSGATVHVHLGSATCAATLAVLDDGDGLPAEQIAPGQRGRVQLLLHQTLAAWHGDRVVLRDAGASRSIAGGVVLDPLAPARYRRTPQRLSELHALGQPTATARMQALLSVSQQGVDLQRLAAIQGLPDAGALIAALPPGTLQQRGAHGEHWALHDAPRAALRTAVLAALATFHDQQPDELGPDAARLRRLVAPRLPEALWRALLADLQSDSAAGGPQLALRGAFVHLPSHGVRLSAVEERIAQKAAPRLADAGYEGAWARDLARDAGETEPLMRSTLARLAQRGELHQVVRDLYYPQATMARLAAIARDIAEEGEGGHDITAAVFRDRTGLGRKRAIQLLEYLDRVGLLRRVGDVHRLRGDSLLFRDDQTS